MLESSEASPLEQRIAAALWDAAVMAALRSAPHSELWYPDL